METLFDHLPLPSPRGPCDPPAFSSVSLVVLSSSSGGNCSALILEGPSPAIFLIDLGLSPRRTRTLLADAGLADLPIAGVIITHLDTDHLSPSWCGTRRMSTGLPAETPLYLHARHLGRAQREGLFVSRSFPYDDPFDPLPGVRIRPHLVAHDSLGCAALRIEIGHWHLGWATDVGRPTHALAHHLADVDVLAVESNYCPKLELASPRPDFLKRRVMGGSGHLSNQQCRHLAQRIAPRDHVVLLHLSRQCNSPELAAAEHAGAPYALTVSSHDRPTQRIPVGQPTYR